MAANGNIDLLAMHPVDGRLHLVNELLCRLRVKASVDEVIDESLARSTYRVAIPAVMKNGISETVHVRLALPRALKRRLNIIVQARASLPGCIRILAVYLDRPGVLVNVGLGRLCINASVDHVGNELLALLLCV